MTNIIRATLILDKEICLNNIKKMARKAAEYNLKFRPHFKTHQSAEIGEWFRLFGVDAITVSSVQMAEYFAANGWNDITIAFSVNIREIENINRLAANINLNVLVENKEAAAALAGKLMHKLGVYIKIDTGGHRTGISSSKTGAINSILKQLNVNSKITFKGFLTHAGQTYSAKSTNEIFSRHFDTVLQLKALKQKYKKEFPNIEVSIGDTPSASICTIFDGIDEIRPGNFIFYDLMQYNLGVCSLDDIAVKMVCPVVAKHPSRNEVVIYGGAVHFSKEAITNVNGKNIYGRILTAQNHTKELLPPLNYVSKLSQEHGTLKVTHNQLKNFTIGNFVEIIPVHSCLTANVMGHYITTTGKIISMMPKY